MSDVKKEELANNQFICKVCWKKSENLKFHVTAYDCDMGLWNGCGEGFSFYSRLDIQRPSTYTSSTDTHQ
jgi:hypothetical protein